MNWKMGHPVDPNVRAMRPLDPSCNDGELARTAGLLLRLVLNPAQQLVVDELSSQDKPWFPVLMWTHANMPGAVMAGLCHRLAEMDQDELAQASNSLSLVYRITREVVDDLAQVKPGAVMNSIDRLHALHVLLQAGAQPGRPDDEDRHCLGKIAHTWLYPSLDQPDVPFSEPGAHGVLAGLANLLVAYGTSRKHPISDPTGVATSVDTLLLEDEDLGPLLVWEPAAFMQGLLDCSTAPSSARAGLRPRL